MSSDAEAVVEALLDSVGDKNDSVNVAVQKTICKIVGRISRNGDAVLLRCCTRLGSNANANATNILDTMEKICTQMGHSMDEATFKAVLATTIKEMTLVTTEHPYPTDYIPSVQMAASRTLVALGKFRCDDVMSSLMELLKPGVLPHYTVPHTMGALALANMDDVKKHVKSVLGRMLPTLGMIRADSHKQAFSYAMANFAVGIVDLLNDSTKENGNANETEDHEAVSNDSDVDLRTEFSIAFDILFLHWLTSTDPNVTVNVLQAIGPMLKVITVEKFNEVLPKLVPNVLSLYRRNNIDLYHVTQTLFYILSQAIALNSCGAIVESILNVQNALFVHILSIPDYDQPHKIKNHFETLRCFDSLLKMPSKNVTIDFLYQKLRSGVEEDRIRSIVILTHLLVTAEKDVSAYFISRLKDMIETDSSVKMKRALLKAIVALAYKDVPLDEDNSILIEYIIKNVSQKDDNNHSREKTDTDKFHCDCESSLYLLSSTVTTIKGILSPLLFKSLLVPKTTGETIVTKCLVQLLQSNRDDDVNDSAKILSEKHAPLYKESVFVRCLSLLNCPKKENTLRCNILTFLSLYCGEIHKNLSVTWQMDLKHLTSYLDAEDFSLVAWEAMILELFRSAIYSVNDERWTDNVCHQIIDQLPKNDSVPQRGILYKFLAVLLCNVVDNKSIETRMNVYFDALANCAPEEDQYLAQALAIASIKHGLYIVERLDDLCKAIDARKLSRFLKFSFIKTPKHDTNIDNMRCVLTMAYSEIAKEVLEVGVLGRLSKTDVEGSGTCIHWLINILQSNSSSLNLIKCAFGAIGHIAEAIHSVSHDNISLNERWKLIELSLNQVSDEGVIRDNLEYYPRVIEAITALIALPQYLSPGERFAVLKILSSKISASLLTSSKTPSQMAIFDVQEAFNQLVKSFIVQSTCPSTLDDILGVLNDGLTSVECAVRLFTIRSTHTALHSFVHNVKLSYESPSRFNQSGFLIGHMIARCTDENRFVRSTAVDCIKVIIQIIDLYEGHTVDTLADETCQLSVLGKKIADADDPKNLHQLGVIVCNKVQHQQMVFLIESLLAGICTSKMAQLSCNVVLNVIFQLKGQDLYQRIEHLMDVALKTLPKLDSSGKVAFLEAMLELAKHHPKNVIEYLLVQPLPFESNINECWSILAQDNSIATLTVDTFLDVLTTKPLFEDAVKYDSEKTASVQCLAAIYGMGELFKQPHTESICEEKFPELFCALYSTLICYIGATPPAHSITLHEKGDKFGFIPNIQSTKISPSRVTVDTIKTLLINTGCTKVIDYFLLCNELDSTAFLNYFVDIVSRIVKSFCEDYPRHVPKLVTALNKYTRGSLIPQRISVVAFFGHLLAHRCNDNLVLLDSVMSVLTAGWKDTALEVRAVSLSGLSNVKFLKKEQRDSLLPSVVTALHQGLDENQSGLSRTNIPLIAMTNLTEMLSMDVVTDLDAFVPIALRIKTFMNTESAALRESSVKLFGEIISKRTISDALLEQILTMLPCFLLHLADEDANVVRACKQTLKKVSPSLVDAPNTNAMIQTHLIEGARLHIDSFLTDLTKCMCSELPQNIPALIDGTANYLNSPWDSIRLNAAIVVGLLFSNYEVDAIEENEQDWKKTRKQLTSRLLQLLKDKNSGIRVAAAAALGGLYASEQPPKKD